MMLSSASGKAGQIFTLLAVVASTLLPMMTMLAMSANPQAGSVVAFGCCSLDSFRNLLDDSELVSSLATSLWTAFAVSATATLVSIPAAIAIGRTPPSTASKLFPVLLVSAFMPPVLFGFSGGLVLRLLGQSTNWLTAVIGQIAVASPTCLFLLSDGYSRVDRNSEDASRNLGASEAQTLAYITLPQMTESIGAGFLLSFVVAFNDFFVAWFLGGFLKTFPVVLYGRLGTALTPSIHAASAIAMVVSTALVYVSLRWSLFSSTSRGRR